jgi:hypothetical protein
VPASVSYLSHRVQAMPEMHPEIETGNLMFHINFARFSQVKSKIVKCPTCEHRRKFLCEFQEWYGWLITCLTCGDRWENGEMLPRPFERGWRKRKIAEAKHRLSKGVKHATSR